MKLTFRPHVLAIGPIMICNSFEISSLFSISSCTECPPQTSRRQVLALFLSKYQWNGRLYIYIK